MPSAASAPEPRASFGRGTPNRITAGMPRSATRLGLVGELVDREAVHARHRGDRLAHAAALDHEERQHQVVAREPRLAHQAPQRLAAAQAAQAGRWESSCGLLPRARSAGGAQRLDQLGARRRARRRRPARGPAARSASAVTGPIAATVQRRAAARAASSSSADEVPHRRRAGEGERIELAAQRAARAAPRRRPAARRRVR